MILRVMDKKQYKSGGQEVSILSWYATSSCFEFPPSLHSLRWISKCRSWMEFKPRKKFDD